MSLCTTEYDTGLSIDLDHLYRRYGPMVWRRCRWLLRDDQQAQDAMQEVFVQLLRRQEGLVIDTPSAMLHRVATNICLNRLRSAKRHPEDPDDALLLRIAAAPEVDSRLPAARLLDRLFDREPPSTRTIATLHLLDGMSLEEVAAEVGLSVSGVRKRLRTLRAHLHELEPALEAK